VLENGVKIKGVPIFGGGFYSVIRFYREEISTTGITQVTLSSNYNLTWNTGTIGLPLQTITYYLY
jgi:hypothetical protein